MTMSWSEAVPLLLEAGRAAPSADNMQPWRLYHGESHIGVGFRDPGHEACGFGPHSLGTGLAMGAVVENIEQLAEALGLGLTWREGRPADGRPVNGGPVNDLAKLASPEPLATSSVVNGLNPASFELLTTHPVFGRHTHRGAYAARPLPAHVLDALDGMQEGGCRIQVLTARKAVARVARLMHGASVLRFQNRELHEWLARSLRFTSRRTQYDDGLDVHTLALPPGGGALLRFICDWNRMSALNKLGVYRLLARQEARPFYRAPAVAVVVGPRSAEAAFGAGRLMERAWVHLNAHGVAVHPAFAVTDQLDRLASGRLVGRLASGASELKQRSDHAFGPSVMPYMLLRLGYARRRAVRSRRLPLAQVCTRLEPSSVATHGSRGTADSRERKRTSPSPVACLEPLHAERS